MSTGSTVQKAERPEAQGPPPRRPQGEPPQRLIEGAAKRTVTFETAPPTVGHRIGLYGPGGVGKTSLADLAPGPVRSFDLDDSLGVLQPTHTQRVAGIVTWQDLRDALNSDGWDDVKTIVIDSITRAEELAVVHTLKNTPKDDKGTRAKSVEDYGYGKGWGAVFDTFLPLLADLDAHVQSGRNVILIAHECTTKVPNPAGEDFIAFQPRLQDPNSGKGSIRLRLREWLDHLLYLGYDVAVDRDNKAKGSGSRTLYPTERPWFMAKSRSLREPIVITENSDELWRALGLFDKEAS